MRGWVHYQLNTAVNVAGDWPIVGRVLWWAFRQWQRLM